MSDIMTQIAEAKQNWRDLEKSKIDAMDYVPYPMTVRRGDRWYLAMSEQEGEGIVGTRIPDPLLLKKCAQLYSDYMATKHTEARVTPDSKRSPDMNIENSYGTARGDVGHA